VREDESADTGCPRCISNATLHTGIMTPKPQSQLTGNRAAPLRKEKAPSHLVVPAAWSESKGPKHLR